MDNNWIKVSQSFNKGITIVNKLDGSKFEQFLRRIVSKLKLQDSEIFTEDERLKLERIFKIHEEQLLFSIKTILYLYKRMLKFIFMPLNLKNDLKILGLCDEKVEVFVKVWSSDTRSTLNELDPESVDERGVLNFSWALNAELSSHHSKNCKVPKAYISISRGRTVNEMEFTHPELHSLFLQFESIQSELDNLVQ